jgi:hypothetical protein
VATFASEEGMPAQLSDQVLAITTNSKKLPLHELHSKSASFCSTGISSCVLHPASGADFTLHERATLTA